MNPNLDSDLSISQLKSHKSKPCLFFIGDRIMVDDVTKNPHLPLQKTIDTLCLNIIHAFLDDGNIIVECECDIAETELLQLGFSTYQIKSVLATIGREQQYHQILKAFHWLNWHRQSKYCGKCSQELIVEFATPEKKCATCEQSFFPRFSPAVMVAIQHENKLLLARSPHFLPGIYSAVAGFIDMGESAEQAAHREVKEELGIEITNLEYFSSQNWPFPDSFMIAFKAQYLSGEIVIAEDEIEDAQWFEKDNLPQLPSHASISRSLIESCLEN